GFRPRHEPAAERDGEAVKREKGTEARRIGARGDPHLDFPREISRSNRVTYRKRRLGTGPLDVREAERLRSRVPREPSGRQGGRAEPHRAPRDPSRAQCAPPILSRRKSATAFPTISRRSSGATCVPPSTAERAALGSACDSCSASENGVNLSAVP